MTRKKGQIAASFFLAYSSTVDLKAVISSETSINFCLTMHRHCPEESTL
jgi:hypothetical protein